MASDFWKKKDSRGNPIIGKKDWGDDHAHIDKDGKWGQLKSMQHVKKGVPTINCPGCIHGNDPGATVCSRRAECHEQWMNRSR